MQNLKNPTVISQFDALVKMCRIRGAEPALDRGRANQYADLKEKGLQRSRRRVFTRALMLAATLALTSACATTTTGKVYQNMALAGAAGAAYGLSQPSYPNTQGILYASLGAAVAAAVTLYLENPDKNEIKLRNEVQSLKAKLDEITQPKLVSQGSAMFGGRVPEKYRGMVNPGEWKIYELDQWTEEGENRLQHVDRVMELIPPSLVPQATR